MFPFFQEEALHFVFMFICLYIHLSSLMFYTFNIYHYKKNLLLLMCKPSKTEDLSGY